MKAVVFVDVQNDFVKGGKLAFGYPIEDNLQKVVEFAKQCVADTNCKIYATRDTHTEDYSNTLEGKLLPIKHCIEGTNGWMIDERLYEVLEGAVTIINKPTFGSFDLAEILIEDQIKEALKLMLK